MSSTTAAEASNFCQLSFDDCLSTPCGTPASGTCTDEIRTSYGVAKYSCACNEGYAIDPVTNQCVDFNECDSDPCVQTKICHNLENDFACGTDDRNGGYICNPGYTGKQCDTEINWCDADPCDSVGTEANGCSSSTQGFACTCKSTEYEGVVYSYRGVTCSEPPQVVSNIDSSYVLKLPIDQETYDSLGLDFEETTEVAMEAAFEGENNFGGITNYKQFFNPFTQECTVTFELIFKIPITDLFLRRKTLDLGNIQAKSGRRITLDLSQISMINDAVSETADSATEAASSRSGVSATKGEATSTASTETEMKADVDACKTTPCENLGTCTDKDGTDETATGRKCECQPDFVGNSCEIQIDNCEINPCLNDFLCIDGVEDYFCDCADSSVWSGKNCQKDDFCTSELPCSDNGLCTNGECKCNGNLKFGYTGTNCAVLDYCVLGDQVLGYGTQPVVCPENSVCISQTDSNICQCAPGFTPPNDCSKSVCDGYCFNNGICNIEIVGLATTVSCDCLPGYSGDTCEFSVCDGNNCSGEGTCGVTYSGQAECTCIPPYAADDCSLVCNDKGTLNADRITCTCDFGFIGDQCGAPAVTCASAGTWQSDNTCLCDENFTGELCEISKIVCGVNGNWASPNNCTCDNSLLWFGPTCEENSCSEITCFNGGECKILENGGMFCDCKNGWTGLLCKTEPPPKCNGNGNEIAGICVCDKEFGGDQCDFPAKDCFNGGTFNQKTTYCDCINRWFGEFCETQDVNFRGSASFSKGNFVITVLVVMLSKIWM